MKSLLQTPEWVDLKVSQGWKSHNIDGVFVLEKSLPLGLSFLYAPEVTFNLVKSHPETVVEGSPANAGSETNSEILRFAQNDNAIFLRLEILDRNNSEIVENLTKNGFIKAFEELQPEWRQIIDINKTEEEILAQMKQKGRYNIKVAQKHGVQVQVIPYEKLNEGLDEFYRLYTETGKHQKISFRGKKYFRGMLEKLYPLREAVIVTARYNSVANASLIITFFDGVATYLYGGTSRENRQVMAPYLAHYEAIREAKRRNCVKYDLLAVSPPYQGEEEPPPLTPPYKGGEPHKYDNLTRFKEQFGGEKVNIVGSYDLVFKPFWYKIFKIIEKYRRK